MFQSNSFQYVPVRDKWLAQKIIIVDGLIGGGKGMLSPIISTLPGVEMWLHRPQWEIICQLNFISSITDEAAKFFLGFSSDYDVYNQLIGRELNVRPFDINGIFNSKKTIGYSRRLLRKEVSDEVVRDIYESKPVLNYMTHANTACSRPLFEVFGERLIYIRLTRSPSNDYMLRHLMRWTSKWESSDVRAGMVNFKTSGVAENVPYIMAGKEEAYINGSRIDKAILLLKEWQEVGDDLIDSMRENSKSRIFEIPFEKFVLDPFNYMSDIAGSVGTIVNSRTKKMMRKQNIPRDNVTDAPHNEIYEKAGWVKKPQQNNSIRAEIEDGRNFALDQGASKVTLQMLDDIQQQYEERFFSEM